MLNRKINILYVIDNLVIGGAQELVKTLALNIDKERFNVSVCSLLDYEGKTDNEPLTEEIVRGGVDVATLYIKRWWDNKEKEKFSRLLIEKRIDVIHSHLYPTDLWSCRLAKSAGVPVSVFTKHETYHNKSILTRIRNSIIYNLYVDKALSISDITQQHLFRYEMINPSKIGKIFNPVNSERFNPLNYSGEVIRKEYDIPLHVPIIGNISRFVQRKGNEFFIETCFKISKQIPESWFILVGYGQDENKYRDLVKKYDIHNHFIFAGARRDIPEVLSAMDIFLFTPICGEALPIVVLEAMSMGKAIVASNVCSNRELIIHEESGLLPTPDPWSLTVNKLDTDSLAESVIRLIKSPDLCKEFGIKARKRVLDTFSLPLIMKKLEDLYIKLLYIAS